MKTINFIRIALILIFLGLVYAVQAQTKKEKIILADETTMTQLSASVKIETSNEKIFQLIQTKFGNIMKGYSVKIKTDRMGEYKEYSIPFKNDVSGQVITYLKNLSKK